MRFLSCFSFLILLAGAAAAQPPATQPKLQPQLDCGVHGDIEILCGAHSPEDLELTPDGKYLIATQFLNQGRPGTAGGGMALFDLSKKTFTKMTEISQPDKAWGDAACPGPIGDALVSHGSSLAKRKSGAWALYVVNHGARQSIEMYELKQVKGVWTLIWRGCEVALHAYNDVAILPDGGFAGSYPSGLVDPAKPLPPDAPNGYVARWTPGKGESEVPGTRFRGPNGVVASADGHFIFVNAFAAREVHKIELESGKDVGFVKVDFLPDNLTWTKDGHLLAAGVKAARGDCPEGSGRPCIQGFGVAELDPAKMTARPIFDSAEHDPLITAVSVALRVGNSIYIGAFQGERIVKIPYKSH